MCRLNVDTRIKTIVILIPYAENGDDVCSMYLFEGKVKFDFFYLTNGRIVVKVSRCKKKVITRVITVYWRYNWWSKKIICELT
jgi:hypothetical protein